MLVNHFDYYSYGFLIVILFIEMYWSYKKRITDIHLAILL